MNHVNMGQNINFWCESVDMNHANVMRNPHSMSFFYVNKGAQFVILLGYIASIAQAELNVLVSLGGNHIEKNMYMSCIYL